MWFILNAILFLLFLSGFVAIMFSKSDNVLECCKRSIFNLIDGQRKVHMTQIIILFQLTIAYFLCFLNLASFVSFFGLVRALPISTKEISGF